MKRKLILFGISGLVGIVAEISILSCPADEVEWANQQQTTSGPTIWANGRRGNDVVDYSAAPTITVEMNAADYLGAEVDWWVVASANLASWYYLNSALQWTLFGDLATLRPVHQGPLFNLSATPVLNGVTLPPGTYDFWFAVDYPMDGILNLNGQILYDKVTVITGGLKTLAEQRGIRFGAYYQYDIRSDRYDQVFETEMNAMTVYFGWSSTPGPKNDGADASDLALYDTQVAWSRTRNMEVYGQTLVWFDELEFPDWLKETPTAEVEGIMNRHIDTFMGRYKGQIQFWNVVNEAVDENGKLRQGHKWVEAMGNDYIRKAFVRAHAADPTAVLYYNDFDIERNEAKFEGVKALLISLKNQGVPVHALGWQMHVTPTSFNAAMFLAHLNEIADLGFDNYITELDVELTNDVSEADFEQQKQTYKTIIETFLAARRHKTIVVWGLRDGDPYWLTNGHPLLFDENYRRKPAYFGVQEALKASSVQELGSKFDLWQNPSFFRGAAVHPYIPYGEKEGCVYLKKQDLQDLRNQGANVVSLNYPGPFKAQAPYGLDQEALEYLDKAIDWSEEVGLYSIIHFRNGPGKSEDTLGSGEWKSDETFWYSEEEKTKWIEMWQFVAQRYRNRSHVIAYNLMVEPHPEDPVRQEPLTADVWNDLARRITAAIREVDQETPIIVSATWWSNPIGFTDLKPTGDSRTIYSFHMYEPFDFTHQGFEWAGKGDVWGLIYPGMIPSDIYEETRYWDKNLLQEFLGPVLSFQKKYNTPIFIGEFGCNRKAPSCVTYLGDLLSIFEEQSWSYTYFLWRDIGDSNGDFDYEKESTGDSRVIESVYMKLFKIYWSKHWGGGL